MKRCVLCRVRKPTPEFNRKAASPDGKQDVCRECNRQVSRDYYARNRDKHLRVVADRKKRVRRDNMHQLLLYLRDHPCFDCGVTDVRVLEFDHLRDKSANISYLVGNGAPWQVVLAEIAKCDVVCSNCHRRRTARRRNDLRRQLLAERSGRRLTLGAGKIVDR